MILRPIPKPATSSKRLLAPLTWNTAEFMSAPGQLSDSQVLRSTLRAELLRNSLPDMFHPKDKVFSLALRRTRNWKSETARIARGRCLPRLERRNGCRMRLRLELVLAQEWGLV